MTSPSRPEGRRLRTRSGTTDPAGAVIPEPRIRGRAGARGDSTHDTDDNAGDPSDGSDDSPDSSDVTSDGTSDDSAVPAEVVHLIPAEHLEQIDTAGMSMPVGIGESASAVTLPGDAVLTRPDESDIPTDAELDRRDAAKGTRRKRTGPPPPAVGGDAAPEPGRERLTPAQTAPPSTDPS